MLFDRRVGEQQLDGKRFTLVYDEREKTLRVVSADEGVQWMYAFWFAWHAFRPQTEVFSTQQQG